MCCWHEHLKHKNNFWSPVLHMESFAANSADGLSGDKFKLVIMVESKLLEVRNWTHASILTIPVVSLVGAVMPVAVSICNVHLRIAKGLDVSINNSMICDLLLCYALYSQPPDPHLSHRPWNGLLWFLGGNNFTGRLTILVLHPRK